MRMGVVSRNPSGGFVLRTIRDQPGSQEEDKISKTKRGLAKHQKGEVYQSFYKVVYIKYLARALSSGCTHPELGTGDRTVSKE